MDIQKIFSARFDLISCMYIRLVEFLVADEQFNIIGLTWLN